MYIQSLKIYSFRNLNSIVIDELETINGFWGKNGQGKTNILEAIYVLLKGKSFRPYSLKNTWIQEEAEETSIKGILFDEMNLPIEVQLTYTQGKWTFFLNNKKSSIRKIRERIPIISFSPDDHALLRQGPDLRREFMNDMFTDIVPGYMEALTRLNKTLKNRNLVLRSLKKSGQMRISDDLKSWTQLFAEAAIEMTKLRLEIWPDFKSRYLQRTQKLFNEETIQVNIEYKRNIEDKYLNTDEYVDYLLEKSIVDISLGWTHSGAQRDDFTIYLNNREAKSHASQAQSRILALSLKWTHADWIFEGRSEKPIFIVDDFSSELDSDKRDALLSEIQQNQCQLFISGTENISGLSNSRDFHIDQGIFIS